MSFLCIFPQKYFVYFLPQLRSWYEYNWNCTILNHKGTQKRHVAFKYFFDNNTYIIQIYCDYQKSYQSLGTWYQLQKDDNKDNWLSVFHIAVLIWNKSVGTFDLICLTNTFSVIINLFCKFSPQQVVRVKLKTCTHIDYKSQCTSITNNNLKIIKVPIECIGDLVCLPAALQLKWLKVMFSTLNCTQ